MSHVISTKVRKRDAALRLAEDTIAAAHSEDRLLTPEEKAKVDAAMAEAREANASLEELDRERALAREISELRSSGAQTSNGVSDLYSSAPSTPAAGRTRGGGSLGAQFVESAAYKGIIGIPRAGGSWQGPAAELDGATLLGSGSGSGGELKLPEYQGGILELLFRRRSVLALFPTATTAANAVGYFRETTFTNAADARAEGAAAAESALVFAKTTDPVESIAHWLPVADEMLDDVPALRGFVDARLGLGLELKTEDQVLAGNGTSPQINGLLNRAGLATMITQSGTLASPTEPLVDAIHRQITILSETNFMMPDAIVMTPALWELIALQKDSTGRYLGEGPFALQPTTLWGLPVVRSPIMTANQALVGSFSMGAQIFYRTGIQVDVSNSHADNFTKMITAIRAVRRAALAVYRPSGFGLVRRPTS